MTGYEVCAHLKASEHLRPVPVIFLSVLDGTQDKVDAFRRGTADYVSKPFQFDELHARVETHLTHHRLQQSLTRHNEEPPAFVWRLRRTIQVSAW
jgi:putative two-component system response regulator